MFHDYRTWTLSTYQQMRADGDLSIHLKRPTPGSIRKECEMIYRERHGKKDEKTIRAFFGVFKEGKTHEEQIRDFDVDKFRPLVKFIKGEIETTEDKNIELLAWLLDLQPRPYQENHYYQVIDKKMPRKKDDISKKKTIKLKRPVIIGSSLVVLLVLISFGIYTFWPKKTEAMNIGGPIPPPAKGNCMIWVKDHYEGLRCEDRAGRQGVLGIDSGRLANFKQIMDTLTINEKSVNKVWYFKNQGKLEYFTAPGYHPIDTNRWLKPLTLYMVRKYLKHPIHP